MNKFKDRLRGSGVLIVVLSAITFSIYTSSTYAEQQHFKIMAEKYEKNMIDYYEKDNNNIDEIYEELYRFNKFNDSGM